MTPKTNRVAQSHGARQQILTTSMCQIGRTLNKLDPNPSVSGQAMAIRASNQASSRSNRASKRGHARSAWASL